jgi:YesN/AraC family two-component response regulator
VTVPNSGSRSEMEPPQQLQAALSILLAEDDKTASEITGLMLARKFPDITIYFAENGRRGVEIFKEHATEIVITDITMPVMDGLEMIGAIRAIKADTKFIVLTAYSGKYLEKFNEISVCAYIPKPLVFNKLFDAIENCIAEIMQK